MLWSRLAKCSESNFSLGYVTNGGSTSDLTTYSFSSVSLGDPDATREIFVVINYNTSTARTITSGTIGGVTASVVNIANGSTSGIGVIHAKVPNGATGAISITFSGLALRCLFGVYRCINRSAYGGTSTNTVTYSNSVKATPAPLDGIIIPVGGFAIGAYGTNGNIVSTVSSSPMTLNGTNSTAAAENLWQIHISMINQTGAALNFTNNLSWTNGSSAGFRAGAASFEG